LAMLEGRGGYVLDAPCGFGHLSYYLSKFVEERRIVGMDLFPAFAYATRRFFVPGAGAVVAHDLDHPLPAAAGAFGAVFSSDAFHYIGNKAGAAGEFLRLLRDDGFIAIPHLHNRLGENLYPGSPLSPGEYADLFGGAEVRVFPERYFLETYIRDAELDLTKEFSQSEIDGANALTVVVAKSKEVFRRYPSVRARLVASAKNPRVNPLYAASRQGGDVVLERRIPEAFRKEYREYPDLVQTLPERVVVKGADVTWTGGRPVFREPAGLLREHVLIEVPAAYE
jgi:SAM-dependent methyltransferase